MKNMNIFVLLKDDEVENNDTQEEKLEDMNDISLVCLF
jgi:hypothetical protein